MWIWRKVDETDDVEVGGLAVGVRGAGGKIGRLLRLGCQGAGDLVVWGCKVAVHYSREVVGAVNRMS